MHIHEYRLSYMDKSELFVWAFDMESAKEFAKTKVTMRPMFVGATGNNKSIDPMTGNFEQGLDEVAKQVVNNKNVRSLIDALMEHGAELSDLTSAVGKHRYVVVDDRDDWDDHITDAIREHFEDTVDEGDHEWAHICESCATKMGPLATTDTQLDGNYCLVRGCKKNNQQSVLLLGQKKWLVNHLCEKWLSL